MLELLTRVCGASDCVGGVAGARAECWYATPTNSARCLGSMSVKVTVPLDSLKGFLKAERKYSEILVSTAL
jgi:hypothetical protein